MTTNDEQLPFNKQYLVASLEEHRAIFVRKRCAASMTKGSAWGTAVSLAA